MVKKEGPDQKRFLGDSVLHQLEMKELKGNCVYPPQHSTLPASLTGKSKIRNITYSLAHNVGNNVEPVFRQNSRQMEPKYSQHTSSNRSLNATW